MENFINWFEIPASEFNRAVNFYKNVLSVELTEMDMHGSKMAFLPSDGKNVSGAIVQSPDHVPSMNGALIYLNGGDDLQPLLNKVEKNNGRVLVPKTQISPEMGYFAIFTDTEGNKMAFHSMN